ncbi:MAG: metallophosphoesterase family protein [Anaerolineae bacterium]
MKLAVISDIHDNVWSLERVLRAIAGERAETLLVLGDLCAPFTLRAIGEGFAGPVHVVFGNNDGDHLLLSQVAQKAGNVTLHGAYAELQPEGGPIAMVHYHTIGRRLGGCGELRAVFYGHSHEAEVVQRGPCVSVNPGEVMGRLGRVTFAVYDSLTGQAELHDVPPGRWQ